MADELLGGFGGDRAGVVHADVDAAESLHCGVDRALHVLFIAHIAHHRHRFAADGLDIGHRGVHRARQPRVRLGGLGQQDDVGALLGRAQRYGQPDAPAAA